MKNRKMSVFFDWNFQFEILAFSFLKTEIIFYIKTWVKQIKKLKAEDNIILNWRILK